MDPVFSRACISRPRIAWQKPLRYPSVLRVLRPGCLAQEATRGFASPLLPPDSWQGWHRPPPFLKPQQAHQNKTIKHRLCLHFARRRYVVPLHQQAHLPHPVQPTGPSAAANKTLLSVPLSGCIAPCKSAAGCSCKSTLYCNQSPRPTSNASNTARGSSKQGSLSILFVGACGGPSVVSAETGVSTLKFAQQRQGPYNVSFGWRSSGPLVLAALYAGKNSRIPRPRLLPRSEKVPLGYSYASHAEPTMLVAAGPIESFHDRPFVDGLCLRSDARASLGRSRSIPDDH